MALLIMRKSTNLLQTFTRTCSNQAGLTIVSEKGGVKRITLNNPKKRNALSLKMLEKLQEDIFKDVDNVNLRSIVLDSSGPVFSSGHDLKELSQSDPKLRQEIFEKCSELMIGIREVPVPVIAVVKGLAAAAGCQLIASCDIVVAGANSQFSTPGASVGLFCSTPGIAVARAVPQKIASYMLLTGSNLNAQDAAQYGLVSRIAPEQELDSVVEEILQAILSKSRSVLALGKKFFYEQLEQDVRMAYNEGSQVMVDNLGNQEAKEGIEAFFQKRPPNWKHA